MSHALPPSLLRLRQSGATAVEFALVFPVFFLILYAVITYALILVTQQALTMAAAEGARAAVRFQGGSDTEAVRATAARAMAQQSLSWLAASGGLATPQAQAQDCPGGVRCMSVVVRYDYANHPLVPPLLGPVLSLPTPSVLQGQAMAQIALVY